MNKLELNKKYNTRSGRHYTLLERSKTKNDMGKITYFYRFGDFDTSINISDTYLDDTQFIEKKGLIVADEIKYEDSFIKISPNLLLNGRRKYVVQLPDGNFNYEVKKGNGIQNKILSENEEFKCSSCNGWFYGIDEYRYYNGEIMCLSCWEDGDV